MFQFFNVRIERHVLDAGGGISDPETRWALREGRRMRIIEDPESELRSILRYEFELEQGLEDGERLYPEEMVREAYRYLKYRAQKKGITIAELIPGWETERELPSILPKVMSVYGSLVLTVNGPHWATKKFRKLAHKRKIKLA